MLEIQLDWDGTASTTELERLEGFQNAQKELENLLDTLLVPVPTKVVKKTTPDFFLPIQINVFAEEESELGR